MGFFDRLLKTASHPRGLPNPTPPSGGPSRRGLYKGKHYTDYVDTVKTLRREGKEEAAERLLLHLVEAAEGEAHAQGYGAAPWYYEQLAIIYRKRKDTASEVGLLERFLERGAVGSTAGKQLVERLDKARARAGKEAG